MRIRTAVLLSAFVLAGQAAIAQPPEESRPAREGDSPVGTRLAERSGRIPTIPVILDGVEYPVGKLPSAEAAPRYYVLTSEDQAKGVVRAFSSPERAGAFMSFAMEKKHGGENAKQVVADAYPYCAWSYGYSYFNKVRGGGGSSELTMFKWPWPDIGERYTNLDFDGWNNTISYVRAACVGYWTTVYSCRNFQLSYSYFSCQDPEVLFIEEGLVVPDLYPYGWNNRASSLRFCRYSRDDYEVPCIEQ